MEHDPAQSTTVEVHPSEQHGVRITSRDVEVGHADLPPWLDFLWATRDGRRRLFLRDSLTIAAAKKLTGRILAGTPEATFTSRVHLPDPAFPGRVLEMLSMALPAGLDVLLAEREGRRVIVFNEELTLLRSRLISAEFLAGIAQPRYVMSVTA